MYNNKSLGSAVSRGVLGLTAACVFAGTALAANEPTMVVSPNSQSQITMQTQVRYADLDLSSERGRATLDERVRFAASDVCDGKNVSNTRSPVAYLNCYTVAVRGAKEQLNQRLAALQGSTVKAAR